MSCCRLLLAKVLNMRLKLSYIITSFCKNSFATSKATALRSNLTIKLNKTSQMASEIIKPSTEFSETEKEKLTQFRPRVTDLLDTDEKREDDFLIRWIRAREGNLDKAEEMLRTSMKWREDNEIDTLLEREGHTLPEEMNWPIGYCGVSKEGYAACIIPIGRFDQRIMLEKYGLEACVRFNMILMEKFSKTLREESKRVGRRVSQMIQICDFEGYAYRQIASKVCRDFNARGQKIMDENYPEVLRYAMIVNAPKIFALVFNFMKHFVAKATLEKIDVIAEPEKWKAVMKEKFPEERIPPHWGGSLEGVDEYCSGHEIWIQGPKDLNAYMRGLSQADSDYNKIVVNAREKFSKEVDVKEPKTILEWKFKTEAHDIGFQLNFSPENEAMEIEEIIPFARHEASTSVQDGSHICEAVGKYNFIFDNAFSILKAKTLLYQISVIDPKTQEALVECPDI